MDSNPDIITQKVEALTKEFNYTVSYDATVGVKGAVKVTVDSVIPNATGFLYYVDGTVSSFVAENTYYFKDLGAGAHNITVVAVGGKFDAAGTYYINSSKAVQKTITILGTVSTTSITVTSEGKISWTPVNNARGYSLILVYDDGTESEPISVGTDGAYEIPNYKANKPVAFKIQTIGNGVTTISSDWVVHYR